MFENPTVILNALRDVCEMIACFSSEFIFTLYYAGGCVKNASEQLVLCIQPS